MFKKIMIILSLVLVIGALVLAAFWDDIHKPRLSDAQKQQISEACAKQGIAPVNWDAEDREPGAVRYYGNYEGYDVFFLFPQEPGEIYPRIRIGEYDFYCPFGGCKIYAYRDGVVEDLEKMFTTGVIGGDVIGEIRQQHAQYNNGGDYGTIMPA